MRFIHCSDLHLGAEPEIGRPWAEARKNELWETAGRIISDCNRDNIDLLMIAGDVFNRQPKLKELKSLNELFKKLTKTKVVMMAGKSDYISPRSGYPGFKWNDNVLMLEDRELGEKYIYGLDTTIYGLSLYDSEGSEQFYRDAYPKASAGFHILLAHGGEDSGIPIDCKRLEEAGFSYVALGHRHAYKKAGERMFYSGSPEPLDKTETGEHGYIRGELTIVNGEEKLETGFVSVAKRKYIDLNLRITPEDNRQSIIKKLTKRMLDEGAGNLYRVYLTGVRKSEEKPDTAELANAGMITEVIDNTIPGYDFERLEKENEGNIIGLFMKSIREADADEYIKERALYYGIEALLSASNEYEKKQN